MAPSEVHLGMRKAFPLEGEAQSEVTLCLGKGRGGKAEVCVIDGIPPNRTRDERGHEGRIIRATSLLLNLVCLCVCVHTPRRNNQ